ncbi:MAG: hypothetical protein QM756_44725 [Polyangiaceae bacterium]
MAKKTDAAPTHTPHPVARAELARRLDRGKATVTRLAGSAWASARMPRGRIDVRHPEFVNDVRRRWGTNPASVLDPVVDPAPTPKAAPAPTQAAAAMPAADAGPALPAELLGWTLTQLTDRFGSAQGLQDWVAARRAIADLSRSESRNAREEERLISRELVREFVMAGFTKLFLRLVTDTPKALALKLASPLPLEQREAMIAEYLSSQLARAKSDIVASIRKCSTGDNPPPVAQPEARGQADELTAFVERLLVALHAEAAAIVQSEWQTFARFGTGPHFDHPTFDRVMAAHAEVTKESTRRVVAAFSSVVRRIVLQEHERRVQQREETPDVG